MSPCDITQDITQIAVGKFQVGITGLKEAIAEVQALPGLSDEEIAQALVEKLRPTNYIPPPAIKDYKQAFLREFKKALGEKGAEEPLGLHIKVLGPGCPNCEALEQQVMATLAELNLPGQVEHVRDLKDILALGVLGTPALMINGEVKVMGKVPTQAMLKKMLLESSQTSK